MAHRDPALPRPQAIAVIAFLGAVPFAEAQACTVPVVVTGVTEGAPFSEGLRFRPFGWSADGKFAWMMSREVDGRGGTV